MKVGDVVQLKSGGPNMAAAPSLARMRSRRRGSIAGGDQAPTSMAKLLELDTGSSGG